MDRRCKHSTFWVAAMQIQKKKKTGRIFLCFNIFTTFHVHCNNKRVVNDHILFTIIDILLIGMQ